MLKVQKRKGRHGGKKLLAAAAALALIAGGTAALHLLREEKEPLPVQRTSGGSIVSRNTEEIVRMRIQVRGREPWSASRNEEGKMTIDGTEGWYVDETLGERLEDALANIVYEDILTGNPEDYRDRLADFGLDDPVLTATAVYSDGTEITLRIGDASGIDDADFRYMTVDGDDRLYAVAGSLMQDLGIEAELLHPVEQPEIQISRIDRIRILNGDGGIRAEWRLEGSITDGDAAENWYAVIRKHDRAGGAGDPADETGIRYSADQEQIGNLKKNAGNLMLGLYVAEAAEADPAEYGLDTPKAVIEIHMAEGSTGHITEYGAFNVASREEETLLLTIGAARNEMTDYALYRDAIYTVNHFTVAALTETDPMSTLARYPVTVPIETLSALTVERRDGAEEEFRLTYTSVPGESEGDPDRTVSSCTRNGEPYSYETFAAIYERMRVVTVSGKLPDGWEKRDTETRFIFQTMSGKTHVVELSPYDGMHDAVTVDGSTLFYLIRGGMDPEF